MQRRAPIDPISLWLHGVGHDGQRRCATAPAAAPQPRRADVHCARSSRAAFPHAKFAGFTAMTGGHAGPPPLASAPARHIPVLVGEVIANLAPHDGGVYIDGTFGARGYTAALLAAARTEVIRIDPDPP